MASFGTTVQIALDTDKETQPIPPQVRARMGDGGGTTIVATITRSGEPYAADDDAFVVKLHTVKPDGRWARQLAAWDADAHQASVTLNNLTLASAGICKQCFFTFEDSSGEVRDSTGNIRLIVERNDVASEEGALWYEEQIEVELRTLEGYMAHAVEVIDAADAYFGEKEAQREQTAEDAEAARAEAFDASQRSRAESFDAAESGRQEAFDQAEVLRREGEQQRILAEEDRFSAESMRVDAEADRALAEQARSQAEAARGDAEAARALAEQARSDAEAGRAAAEGLRAGELEGWRDEVSGWRASESAAASAETVRQANEEDRISAESGRIAAEADRIAAFAQMQDAISGFTIVLLTEGEYDPETARPTISAGAAGVKYLVPDPDATDDNAYVEWFWYGGRFERYGRTSYKVEEATAEQVAAAMGGEAVVGSGVITLTTLSQARARAYQDLSVTVSHLTGEQMVAAFAAIDAE